MTVPVNVRIHSLTVEAGQSRESARAIVDMLAALHHVGDGMDGAYAAQVRQTVEKLNRDYLELIDDAEDRERQVRALRGVS